MRLCRSYWVALAFTLVPALPDGAAARVLRIGPGSDHAVPDAIEAAEPGDTLDLAPGIYTDLIHPHVDVTIRGLEGPEVTVLDGEGTHRILEFEALTIRVENLTFRNGHADDFGGAVFFHSGSLTVDGCVFRDNRAEGHFYGGAICYCGIAAALSVEGSLFVDNGLPDAGSGGAISYGMWETWGECDDPLPAFNNSNAGLNITRSTFIRNAASNAAAVYVRHHIPVLITGSLFLDSRGRDPAPIWVQSGYSSECNLFWNAPSPAVPEAPEGKRLATESGDFMADPLLCPDAPESVHESSPVLDQPCGAVGSLPIGCRGPMIVGVWPRALHPVVEQKLRVYAYGLARPRSAALVGPSRARIEGTVLDEASPWMTLGFDLSATAPGAWDLAIESEAGTEVTYPGIQVDPTEVLGFVHGWLSEPSDFTGTLFGRGIPDEVDLHLRHAESGALFPLAVRSRVWSESLRVQCNLSSAPKGRYDLLLVAAGQDTAVTRDVLYIGEPATVRVPQDAATIQEALDLASPFTEVLVSPQWYEESITIRKPVRLTGVGPNGRPMVKPGAPGERVIHVLPEAGPLTEIKGFFIASGDLPEGPGAGIYAEAPVLIQDNFLEDNKANGAGGRGGGVFVSDGGRIVRNDFYGNEATGAGDAGDPWSTRPAAAGAGGGLFCLNCLVDKNHFYFGSAAVGGSFVVDGTFRRNTAEGPGAGMWGCGALRGRILNNAFKNTCGAYDPYLLLAGPSRVGWNTFTDTPCDMGAEFAKIGIHGSMELFHNTFYNVSVDACLATEAGEPTPGFFRAWDNAFHGGVTLHEDPAGTFCASQGGVRPLTPIPPSAIAVTCNIAEGAGVQIESAAGTSDCDSCVFAGRIDICGPIIDEDNEWNPIQDYDLRLQTTSQALPENSPVGCPDTLGALGVGCAPLPVLLQRFGVERLERGVRLYWSTPVDVTVSGFRIRRDADGVSEMLTPSPLAPCGACEYLDENPPPADRLEYTLILVFPSGEEDTAFLGSIEGAAGAPEGARPRLWNPVPNPVRGETEITFSLPRGSGPGVLELLDPAGRHRATLWEGSGAGDHRIRWDRRDRAFRTLSSGIYLLHLRTRHGDAGRKILLLE
jgi:hypothetical protein